MAPNFAGNLPLQTLKLISEDVLVVWDAVTLAPRQTHELALLRKTKAPLILNWDIMAYYIMATAW